MSEIEQIAEDLKKLPRLEGIDSAGQKALSDVNRRRHLRDRSFIVHAVVSLYVVAVGLLVAAALYKGIWGGDESAFSNVSELLKIGVLPVVTLVIGYYFGISKSE